MQKSHTKIETSMIKFIRSLLTILSLLYCLHCTASIDDSFEWLGSFKFPANGNIGDSRFSYTTGTIALGKDKHSLFIAGHQQYGGIAEIIIPTLVKSDDVTKLNIAKVKQPFTSFLKQGRLKDNKKLNTISGMRLIDDNLVVNAIEYYDADADNQYSTFVIKDANNLATTDISSMKMVEGSTYAAGWITKLPKSWALVLGKSYLMGSASNYPIFSRLSIGPSFYLFDKHSLTKDKISTEELLSFSLEKPMAKDLYRTIPGQSWTAGSRAAFGFVLPDMPIYLVIGSSSGHRNGLGYKLKRPDGSSCAGQCPTDPNDRDNYAWGWSLEQLMSPSSLLSVDKAFAPTFHGPIHLHHSQESIVGADFDYDRHLLYILIDSGDRVSSKYEPQPIVKVFKYKGWQVKSS